METQPDPITDSPDVSPEELRNLRFNRELIELLHGLPLKVLGSMSRSDWLLVSSSLRLSRGRLEALYAFASKVIEEMDE